MILTNRKEEQSGDKYPKASLAPIKVIKFGSISAGVEHWCSQLCGLSTRITWGNRETVFFSHSSNIISLIPQRNPCLFMNQILDARFYHPSRRTHYFVYQCLLHLWLQWGRPERSHCGSSGSPHLWTSWKTHMWACVSIANSNMRSITQYCRIRFYDSCFCFESPLERSLPILFVLEPEAVSVSDAFKLVQDYGRENWTRTIEGLQQSSREELQFWDVSVIQFYNIVKQLLEQNRTKDTL